MNDYRLEVIAPGQPVMSVGLADLPTPAEIGRERVDVQIPDPAISRRHLALRRTHDGVLVQDLASSHGVFVNGRRIAATTLVRPGDELRLGNTVIRVVATPTTAAPDGTAPATLAPTGRPDLDCLAAIITPDIVVRYVAGAGGERVARVVAAQAAKAIERLAPLRQLGAQPPTICLVEPYPDPHDHTRFVTNGVTVDAERQEIWMVATAESPPEHPGRGLALLVGAGLPAADELQPLLEGYGLWIGRPRGERPDLSGRPLPALFASDDDERRPAMMASFVDFLVEREGEEALQTVLLTAAPGGVAAAIRRGFGLSVSRLEERWREQAVTDPEPPAERGELLSLARRYLPRHARRQAEIFLLMLVGLSMFVAVPLITRSFIDDALPSGEFGDVVVMLVILGSVFGLSLAAGLRRGYLSQTVSNAVIADLRTDMFTRLQRLPARWYQEHPAGDVQSRLFSDVAQVELGLSQAIRDGVFVVASMAVSAAVMLYLNLLLGAIVLLGVPLVAMMHRGMTSGAERRSLAVQERTAELMSLVDENHAGERVVKTFGLAGTEQARFRSSVDRLLRSQRRLDLFSGLFAGAVNAVAVILRLVVFGLGGWLVVTGHLTIGSLVGFLMVMADVMDPVDSLVMIGQQVQAARGSLRRIDAVLAAPSEPEPSGAAMLVGPVCNQIQLQRVSFSHCAGVQVLSDVDVVIEAGSRVAFVGPSGAGKSTILQLLLRLADPDSGTVTFDGTDIRSLGLDTLRAQIGVVFQESFLFDATVRENIAIGRRGATDAEIEAAARAAEIHEFLEASPLGYDTPVGERGTRLSGGQRQRIAIARMLLRNPSVLLLDEATSALDPATEQQIMRTLRDVGASRTTISVTHRLTSIVDYDRIHVVVDGRIAERGTHTELLARGGPYARLWSEQSGTPVTTDDPVMDPEAALAGIPILNRLPAARRRELALRAQRYELPAGARLPEDPGRIYVLLAGAARVVPRAFDDLRTDAPVELSPGAAFGVSALIGEPTSAELVAAGPVLLLLVPELDADDLTACRPTLGGPDRGRHYRSPTLAHRRTLSPIGLPAALDPAPRVTGTVI